MGTSMQTFKRPPEGFRFKYSGTKVNAPADVIPADKYAMGINVRGYNDDTTRTRPGMVLRATLGASTAAAICAFQPLQTNPALANPPRFLATDRNGVVWLDSSTQAGALASVSDATVGASMIPFRPNQSPNPYIYIGSAYDYQKFSAPSASGAVLQSKAGIKEPQVACGAIAQVQSFNQLLSPGNLWSVGGAASNPSSPVRSTDQVVIALIDPAIGLNYYSVQVSPNVQYQRGEVITFPGTGATYIIRDVLPPLSISMTVQGIIYTGPGNPNTGPCIVVPMGVNMSLGQSVPEDAPDSGTNSPLQSIIAVLQRGSLIRIGSETCYVRSVIPGPTGQIAIETSTTQPHSSGETIIGLPAITVGVSNPATVAPGAIILGDPNNTQAFTVTGAALGTLTSGNAGGTGNVVARPTVLPGFNGWGANAHVGLYEGGTSQGRVWGLNGSATLPYASPQLAFDGVIGTAATANQASSHQYFGCIWVFPATVAGLTGLSLNIFSGIPTNVSGGNPVTLRSASIFYSLDGGVTWTLLYDISVPTGGSWSSVPIPSGQDTSKIQVMAFMDSHDDFAHSVNEINLTSTPISPSIGASTGAFTGDDYLHFSIKLDNPQNLIEARLMLDVSDGTFQSNYLYASVDQSAFVGATLAAPINTSQAAVQTTLQTQAIDEASKGTGLSPPLQTVAGANQWTEIWIPISELTRIGGDQTKTLANIVAIQLYINASATINVTFSSMAFVGGFAPDVGDDGAPYQYRVIGRSSITGAKSNPSPAMRYGVNPRRASVGVFVPPVTDPQIDTWDVFRFGGSITSYRYIGSVPITAAFFIDNFDDSAAEAGPAIEFDNFEPWPTIDVPLNQGFVQVIGTILVLFGNAQAQSNWGRYLPGNLVRIGGGNVYSLRTRPTFLGIGGNTWVFELEQNAGVNASTTVSIYEPAMANQPLPYLWGTDDNGVCFGCGDPLRPGTLYFSKPNNLDSAPDGYNIEIVQPTEPLIGGEVLDGTAYVASTRRWWRLYPQLDNALQRYRPVQEPLPRGLAAPWGKCNDGQALYWVAEDGIYSSAQGSLTDADLYTLFPHEGVPGRDQNYGGHTFLAPDYSRVSSFRLAHSNGYLYFDYQDASGNWNTLTLELRTGAWARDDHTPNVSVHYAPPTISGTTASPRQQTPKLFDVLMMGTVAKASFVVPGSTAIPQVPGNITIPAVPSRLAAQQDLTNDLDAPITVALATREFDAGDVRAGEQWGDYYVDLTPPSGMSVTPMSDGLRLQNLEAIVPPAVIRTPLPLSLGGALLSNFLGFMFEWTDDYTKQAIQTTLFVWQPSYIDKPETIIDRFTDWDDVGVKGNKFWQGFVMRADTFNKAKGLAVRDADSLTLHPFTQAVLHNGESEIAYSFDTPFIAHTVRIEPANDSVPWRFFDIRWVVEPTPEFAQTWITQPATHGGRGYQHIRQVAIQYAATAAITLQIITYDGQSPLAILLPTTGGKVVKVVFPVSANKGQNFTYNFTAGAPFQIYRDQCEVLIGQWNRGQGRYQNVPLVGGTAGEQAGV